MKSTMKILALAILVTFAFTSCAKAPTQLMDQAKAAIQGVVDAKGGIYAKDELNKLQGDLQAAMDEVNAQSKKFFKKYGPAKEMLTKLVTDADAVKAQIPARIEEAKKAAEAAINEAKAAFDKAKALLEKAPKGKGTKADIEAMKADLSGLETQMTEVQSAMTAEDYFGAKDKAVAIKDKATAIAEQVQKAIDKVKGVR
jgi:chromosome segregation ATPase